MKLIGMKFRKAVAASIPLPVFLILVILFIIVYFWKMHPATQAGQPDPAKTGDVVVNRPGIRMIRSHDFELVSPVLFAEIPDESPEFKQLKCQLSLITSEKKKNGVLNTADIYIRRLNTGKWMKMGEGREYPAGSLLKVPILMTWLKMAEKEPGLLQKRLNFEQPPGQIPDQSYIGKSIVAGKDYTVAELLEYLIVESDNNATWLLTRKMDLNIFQKLFTDLGLRKPELSDGNYAIKAHEYSMFMVVLYNASFLSPEHSQFALKLLSKSTFKKGLVRKLPAGVLVAHKFGEQGTGADSDLSESAVVYAGGQPYVITVMAQGAHVDSLSDYLSDISLEVYRSMAAE